MKKNGASPMNRRLIETMLWKPDGGIELLEEHYSRFCGSLRRCGITGKDIPREAVFARAIRGAATSFLAKTEGGNAGSSGGPDRPDDSCLRLKLLYDPDGPREELLCGIEAQPFVQRRIRRVGRIDIPGADYSLKWENRSLFTDLHRRFPGFDEIIITRSGALSDGTWTNLFYLPGPPESGASLPSRLHPAATPDSPLLKGARRQRLLRQGELYERHLTWEEITGTPGVVGFINALNPPGALGYAAHEDIVALK